MIVGTVKEIKNNEFRVGLTPAGAAAFAAAGHTVLVERGAGLGSGFEDCEYQEAKACLCDFAAEVWTAADLMVKVKEPIPAEYRYFRRGQIIYTYLHLAADRPLADALLAAGTKAVAFETIVGRDGGLPCLQPMSEIAGRLSVQEGAKYLEKPFGGRGLLLSGVPGVERGNVVIIGGGTVGTNACKVAAGLGASVTILDVSAKRLAYLDDIFSGRITTLFSTPDNIKRALASADLVIGAVLIPGCRTPRLVTREHLKLMKKGAVIVDVAVDQGGCVETCRATTHDDPVFVVDGVVHYCVANMPGAVSRTSTLALENETLPYGLQIAGSGLESACRADSGLMRGINCYEGKCTCRGVAEALGLKYTDASALIG